MAFLLVIIVYVKLRQNDSTEMKIATYSIVLTQYCHCFDIQYIDICRPTFIKRKICRVIDSKNNYYAIASSRSGSCFNRSNISYQI